MLNVNRLIAMEENILLEILRHYMQSTNDCMNCDTNAL